MPNDTTKIHLGLAASWGEPEFGENWNMTEEELAGPEKLAFVDPGFAVALSTSTKEDTGSSAEAQSHVEALKGKYAHVPGFGVDDFLACKRKELD
jgi:hypothetical protein